jgi:hypothetical protein
MDWGQGVLCLGCGTTCTHLSDVIGLELESLAGRGDTQEVRLVIERSSGDLAVVQDPVLQQSLWVGIIAL